MQMYLHLLYFLHFVMLQPKIVVLFIRILSGT